MASKTYRICALPGDGIGPEIIAEAKKVLAALGERYDVEFVCEDHLIGGAAIDATTEAGGPVSALPAETLEAARASDAVLLAAVGGPKWTDTKVGAVRPEQGLLAIRKELGLYANLRPAKLYPSLKNASSLRADIADKGIDLVIVRELTGGIYFGERGYRTGSMGREAFDTESYAELEIERVARIAYELAEKRSRRLCLVDKANVLTTSKLWRKVTSDLNEDYPSVAVEMMYVDNAAMQLALAPSRFDVVLTSNLFGDILSDLAAATVGSIGMMPSASLGETTVGMYEAIHGSAPSIAGLDRADPAGTILSAAMMLRLSFDLEEEATAVEHAVEEAVKAGACTPDIGGSLGTRAMTDAIISRI